MKVYFEGNVVNLPEGTTVEGARDALSDIFPAIANASVEDTDDGIKFTVQSGTKGADLDPEQPVKVVYGDTILNLPAGTSAEDARETVATFQPEVATASISIREDNVVHFEVKSGTKGN